MLHMLLFTLSWIHSSLDRQMHGIAIVKKLESPFASGPLPLRSSRLLRVLLLAAGTAEADHCCCLPPPPVHCCSLQAAPPMLQPTCNRAMPSGPIPQTLESGFASGDSREQETCRVILELLRDARMIMYSHCMDPECIRKRIGIGFLSDN